MKIGICLNMAARDARKLGMDLLPDIKHCGYDFVEMSVGNSMALDRVTFMHDVYQPIHDSGIPCYAMNAFCGADQQFVGTAQQARALDYTQEALDRAAVLGAKVVVIGAGLARSIAPGYPVDSACDQMAELFCRMSDLAKPYGIRLALEGLNRSESNMFTNMDDVMAQVKKVDHPNFGALVDYYHFTLGNEDPAKLTDMAKDLVHLHFARVLCRVIPKDFGEDAGYVPFLQAIKAGGYEGAISIEANCPDEFYNSAKQGLDVLRAACTKAGF